MAPRLQTPSIESETDVRVGSPQRGKIIELNGDLSSGSLCEAIETCLINSEIGEPQLPGFLLYDELGLQYFDAVCLNNAYYPTNTEVELIGSFADDMVADIQDGTILIEFGSGNLKKALSLLSAIDSLGRKNISFYAVDIDRAELVRTVTGAQKCTRIPCYGVLGTFEDTFRWISSWGNRRRPLWTLLFGSTIGNMSLKEAHDFMRKMSYRLAPGSGDSFVISIDHCSDNDKLWNAYHDPEGDNERFNLNALHHFNTISTEGSFDTKIWRYNGDIIESPKTHRVFFEALEDATIGAHRFKRGSRINIVSSIKYCVDEAFEMFTKADLHVTGSWTNASRDYSIYRTVRQ